MLRPSRVGIGLVLVLATMGGCGGEPSPGGVRAAKVGTMGAPADGSAIVRYELDGTAIAVDGTYAEPSASGERTVEFKQTPLPWSRTFTLAPQQLFLAGLTAHGPNLETTVSCRITKNGAVVAEETGPSVDCRTELVAGS